MFNLNTLNVSFWVRRREWENFHQHILRWQQNKLSMWRTLSSCRPRDVLLSHSNMLALYVQMMSMTGQLFTHSINHSIQALFLTFAQKSILNIFLTWLRNISPRFTKSTLYVFVSLSRELFLFLLCTVLSHMLGHVTSSANGQLYTIKINKDFLRRF